jgi:hypothetical protein
MRSLYSIKNRFLILMLSYGLLLPMMTLMKNKIFLLFSHAGI